MSYAMAPTTDELSVELHTTNRQSTQLLSRKYDTPNLQGPSVPGQSLEYTDDVHIPTVAQLMNRYLPLNRRYRYIAWLPLWIWLHITNLFRRILSLNTFNREKKPGNPPGKFKRFCYTISRYYARMPPKLAWRKMLLLWTFLVWLACIGFILFVTLRKSPIVELEKVISIPCSRRRLWQILILSLPLNIFASLLVAASSFTRQILMSPTRQQLDRAHRNGNSLAIAMPSMRNLRSMGFFKGSIWVLLIITSFPFHFLLNSILFATIAGHDSYQVMLSQSALSDPAPPTISDSRLKAYNTTKTALRYDTDWPGIDAVNDTLAELHSSVNVSIWQNLTWLECFDSITLTQNYKDQRNFIMVTDYEDSDDLIIGLAVLSGVNYGTQRPVAICPEDYLASTPGFHNTSSHLVMPRTSKIKINGTKVGSSMCWPYWNGTSTKLGKDNLNSDRFSGYDPAADIQLKYCLKEMVEPQCAIYYSPWITLILAGVTGLQALFMTLVFLISQQTPLVLPGDVMASYLKHPDVHTAPGNPAFRRPLVGGSDVFVALYWVVTVFLVIQLVVLISWGSTAMQKPGLIRADESPKTWFIAPICISGAVQLVLVVREYLENVVATVDWTMREFSRFEYRRAPLRVSYPRSSPDNRQKAAYILQLPLVLAVWHIATSAFIHWWVSLYFSVQLFMVIRLDGKPDYPELSARPNTVLVECFGTVFTWFKKIFTGAFSGLRSGSGSEFVAILFLIIVVPFTVALFVIFAGPLLLHYASVLPLLVSGMGGTGDGGMGDGTNSLAISSACHPPPGEGDISEKDLQWGYVELQAHAGDGRLTLSSRRVQPAYTSGPDLRSHLDEHQQVEDNITEGVGIADSRRSSEIEAQSEEARSPPLTQSNGRRGSNQVDRAVHDVPTSRTETSRRNIQGDDRDPAEGSGLLEDEDTTRRELAADDEPDHFTDFGAYRHLF